MFYKESKLTAAGSVISDEDDIYRSRIKGRKEKQENRPRKRNIKRDARKEKRKGWMRGCVGGEQKQGCSRDFPLLLLAGM